MTGLPGAYSNQRLDWTPGSRDLVWDRTIVKIDAASAQITVDAPITTALERRYGGGSVARVESNPPVINIGIDALTLESEFDPARPRDEDHSWTAVSLDRVEDAWVRAVVARHFAGSAVRVGRRARRIAIEACRSEQPVSEPAGYRRQTFLVEGQQVLVRQCAANQGMNDFASGLLAGGPNVFLDSTATAALGPSGSFESWASGVLYERVRVEGAGIRLANDSSRAQGAGWTAGNSVVWNCDASEIDARGPEGAENIVRRSSEPLYEVCHRRGHGARIPSSENRRARAAAARRRNRERTLRGGWQDALGRRRERRLVARPGGPSRGARCRRRVDHPLHPRPNRPRTHRRPGRPGRPHGGAGHAVLPVDSRPVVRPPARRALHQRALRRQRVGALL
jgi:hypothetical protein